MTIDEIRDYFKNDSFAIKLNFVIEDAKPGASKASVKLAPDLMNGTGIPHGGLIFSLCDFAGSLATNSYGLVTLSIDSSISYLNKTQGTVLYATAVETSRSRRISHVQVNVYDDKNIHVATSKNTYYITPKEIII